MWVLEGVVISLTLQAICEMGLSLELGQKITALESFLSSLPESVFFCWLQRRNFQVTWVKRVTFRKDRKQKYVKTTTSCSPLPFLSPFPFFVLFCFVFEWSSVEFQVEPENLTQISGWMMDSLCSGCTRLYISVIKWSAEMRLLICFLKMA